MEMAQSLRSAYAGLLGCGSEQVALTGSTTDVGTGPVLVLLAVAFWPAGIRAPGRRAGQPAAEMSTPAAITAEAQSAAGRDPSG